MQINKSFEIEEGKVQFSGEISGPELDLVIQTGLLTLMRQGVIASAEKELDDHTGELH